MCDPRDLRETRRRLLGAAGGGTLAATFGWILPAHAQRGVSPTAWQPLGPFYPVSFPEDQDNDLTRVKGATKLAEGEILFVAGSLFDQRGKPLAGVRVEIWQCNARGRYHHPMDTSAAPVDPGFQGFGATVTGAAGSYDFKTIKPVPYTGRTPHIHFKLVRPGGGRDFVTQMYIAGHPGNERDSLLASIRDPRARDSLLAPVVRIAGTAEWTARFDIVLPDA